MRASFRCPSCGNELVVATRIDVDSCITCGRTIQEHDEKYGHHRWCEFPDNATSTTVAAGR